MDYNISLNLFDCFLGNGFFLFLIPFLPGLYLHLSEWNSHGKSEWILVLGTPEGVHNSVCDFMTFATDAPGVTTKISKTSFSCSIWRDLESFFSSITQGHLGWNTTRGVVEHINLASVFIFNSFSQERFECLASSIGAESWSSWFGCNWGHNNNSGLGLSSLISFTHSLDARLDHEGTLSIVNVNYVLEIFIDKSIEAAWDRVASVTNENCYVKVFELGNNLVLVVFHGNEFLEINHNRSCLNSGILFSEMLESNIDLSLVSWNDCNVESLSCQSLAYSKSNSIVSSCNHSPWLNVLDTIHFKLSVFALK